MDLRPEGYNELAEYLVKKARFKSNRAIINAALDICCAFRALHLKGLSYQDLNDGNFFINSETGRVEEFAGTAISQENVPFLCGIDIVEEKLPKGDKVDSLFFRGNGLIVLNYEHEEEDITYYYHYIYDFTKGFYIDAYGDEMTSDEPLMGTCAVTICPDIANYPDVHGPEM